MSAIACLSDRVKRQLSLPFSTLIHPAHLELESIATCTNQEKQADLRCSCGDGAGEEARSAALQVTTARLVCTNSLLREVAIIQRHAEQLCPGQHPISDVMSEFSVDEPETSSHAVHAEPGSNHAESSHGACAVADASSKSEASSETANASANTTTGKSRSPIPAGPEVPEPAVCASLQANVHGMPQGCATGTSAGASTPYKPIDYSAFDSFLNSDEGCACLRCRERAQAAEQAAAVAAAPPGPDRLAEANEESPLPGIMSGLQQAMTDSISSSGRFSRAMTACWFVA